MLVKSCEPLSAPQAGPTCFLAEMEQCSIVSRHPYQMNSAQLSSFAARGKLIYSVLQSHQDPSWLPFATTFSVQVDRFPFAGLVSFIYYPTEKQNALHLYQSMAHLFLRVLTTCPTLLSACFPLHQCSRVDFFMKAGIQMSRLLTC